MSFIASALFGGSPGVPTYQQLMARTLTPAPAPLPAPGADTTAASMEAQAKQKRRQGFDQTILGSQLGDVGGQNARSTMLLGD